MEERNIDELISRYLAGEAGPEEAMELEDWKEANADNLAYYLECEQLFFANLAYQPITNEKLGKALETVKEKLEYEKPALRVFKLPAYLKIAAAIALIAAAGLAVNYFLQKGNTTDITYVATTGEKKVMLQDNSSVLIASNSSITVDKGFGKTNRLIKLKGSAYFEVIHTDELPLVVDAGHIFIKDIGTKFNIISSYTADTVLIKVDEGVVSLFDSAAINITLTAGQQATYIKSQQKILQPEAKKAVINLLFNGELLKDVVARLNRDYNTTINIENQKLENCQLTAKFTDEDLETILDIITETLGLTYIKTSNGYTIQGERCIN